MALAFGAIGVVPGIANATVPFLVFYGLSYFFTEFGPNTTTFVYPSEIFPVRVRTTAHGIAASAGKLGAFAGTFAIPLLLDAYHIDGAELVCAILCVVGLGLTLLLPEPKAKSLETMAEEAAEDVDVGVGAP